MLRFPVARVGTSYETHPSNLIGSINLCGGWHESYLSVSYFKPASGRPLAGTAGTISADAPPHPECWQSAGAELRCCYRLIHNQRRRKSVLIIDLDCVTDSSCDIAPVKCDVCPGREARVGGRRKQRRWRKRLGRCWRWRRAGGNRQVG